MVEALVVLIIDRFKDYVYSKRQMWDSSWQNLNLGNEQIKTFHTIPIDKTHPKQITFVEVLWKENDNWSKG